MYKNRVKNDGIFFEIPTLLSCKQENQAENRAGKFKITYIYIILNFPTLFSAGFPRLQDKRAGISKNFLSFSTLFLYIPWLELGK